MNIDIDVGGVTVTVEFGQVIDTIKKKPEMWSDPTITEKIVQLNKQVQAKEKEIQEKQDILEKKCIQKYGRGIKRFMYGGTAAAWVITAVSSIYQVVADPNNQEQQKTNIGLGVTSAVLTIGSTFGAWVYKRMNKESNELNVAANALTTDRKMVNFLQSLLPVATAKNEEAVDQSMPACVETFNALPDETKKELGGGEKDFTPMRTLSALLPPEHTVVKTVKKVETLRHQVISPRRQTRGRAVSTETFEPPNQAEIDQPPDDQSQVKLKKWFGTMNPDDIAAL